jgi:hypothetical protein
VSSRQTARGGPHRRRPPSRRASRRDARAPRRRPSCAARRRGPRARGGDRRLPREEPFEREAIGRKPGDGERRDDGRRAGDRGDGDALRDGLGDEHVPGVADGGHARVAQHQQVLVARPQGELGGALTLVVIVEGDELRAVRNAEPASDAVSCACPPRRRRSPLECRDEPGRGIPQVSDGRRGEDDHRPSIGLCP